MAILIDRMKIFSPYASQRFTARPKHISFLFLLICIFTDLPTLFSLKIVSLGNYSNTNAPNDTLYFFDSSEFSLTSFGQTLMGFTSFFSQLTTHARCWPRVECNLCLPIQAIFATTTTTR